MQHKHTSNLILHLVRRRFQNPSQQPLVSNCSAPVDPYKHFLIKAFERIFFTQNRHLGTTRRKILQLNNIYYICVYIYTYIETYMLNEVSCHPP